MNTTYLIYKNLKTVKLIKKKCTRYYKYYWYQRRRQVSTESKRLLQQLKKCRGKRRTNVWAESIVNLLTECLDSSTQKLKISDHAKRWWNTEL